MDDSDEGNKEPRGMKRKFSVKQSSDHEKIFSLKVPFQNASLILMNHPASLILYKYVSVTALSGSVSIHGSEISSKSKPHTIQVFSSEKTGLISVTTESYENIWKKKTTAKGLLEILEGIFNKHDTATKILQKVGQNTVVVYVQRCEFPTNIEFAEFYCPQAFEYNLCQKSKHKDRYWFRQSEVLSPLQFDEEKENLASEIALLIRSSSLVGTNFPKVLVIGPRNTGKSTLLRYLINKMLSQTPCFYLDTDPGQPEFTPPGVVSLTEVKQPVTGPPFLQQDRNSKMIFIGDISPSSIDMYSESISKLMELYTTEYFNYPLFINTMGWIEGAGLEFLKNISDIVKPTVLIEIVPEGKASFFDYRDYLSPDGEYFQICCEHGREANALAPKVLRELSLLSQLGKCQPPYLDILPINEMCPYFVSWKDISLFIFPGKTILPSRMIEALNGSIVALCHVSKTDVFESKISKFPKTLACDSENECFAYGFVQAVNEADNLLYVISPLKKHEWAKVNAIIKGNVMVPDCLILKQELYNDPLPYINVNVHSIEDEDNMDISLLSLNNELHESEPSTPALKMSPALENYRRPVSNRYHPKFLKIFTKK